jgi:uncharacterized membrane protein
MEEVTRVDGWTLLIAAHAAGATLALLLGGYVVLRPRKGDLLHRRLGKVWVATMYWVTLSSFGIKELTPGRFSWIHGLSLWTIVSLTIAVWAAVTHRARLHRDFVIGSYLGLVGAGIAAMAFPVRLVPQMAVHDPVLLLAAVAGIAVVATAIIRVASLRPWTNGGRRPPVPSGRDDVRLPAARRTRRGARRAARRRRGWTGRRRHRPGRGRQVGAGPPHPR